MSAHDRRIENAGDIFIGDSRGAEDFAPLAALGPAMESIVDGLPLPEPLRHVAPLEPSLRHVDDSVNEVSVAILRWAPWAATKQFLDLRPLIIGQLVPAHALIRSDEGSQREFLATRTCKRSK